MLKEWFKKIKKRRRLRKMERTLGIRLKKWQAKAVMMDGNPICELGKWDRRSGKTWCACLWTMLNAEEDISIRELKKAVRYFEKHDPDLKLPPALPDPDAYRSLMTLECAVWEYRKIGATLERSGIKVPRLGE